MPDEKSTDARLDELKRLREKNRRLTVEYLRQRYLLRKIAMMTNEFNKEGA